MTVSVERQDALRAVADAHDVWVAGNLDAPFDPGGFGEGSDYNQHYVDLDAAGSAQDAYDEQAAELLSGGITVAAGAKKDHTSLDTDLMDVDVVEAGLCVPCLLAPQPGEMWHAIAHTEGVSTGQRVWLPGALSWREPPFSFHWELESSAHGGTARIVQVGMVTRVEKIGDQVHAWGNIDMQDRWGGEAARKLAQGFLKGVSMGPGSERIGYDQVWPSGVTAEQRAHSEPEQWVFTSYRIGELTAVSVEAQEGAFLEPTPELLMLMGVEAPRMEQEMFMVASAGAVHRPGLNCCRSPLHPGPCKGWKGNRQTPSVAPERKETPFKNTPAQNRAAKKQRDAENSPEARSRAVKAGVKGAQESEDRMNGPGKAPTAADKAKAQKNIEDLMDKAKSRSAAGNGWKSPKSFEQMSPSEIVKALDDNPPRRRSPEDREALRGELAKLKGPHLRRTAEYLADALDLPRLPPGRSDQALRRSILDELTDSTQVAKERTARRSTSLDDSIVTAGASWTITVSELPSEDMFVKDFPAGTPPTLTEDGRFFGYFAPGNTAHRGAARGGVRKTAKQLGKTDYSRWLRRLPTAEGTTVLAGPITMECMHAPTQGYGTLDRRHQFYEDSCSIIARASVGEDNDGARWFAGTIMPGVTSAQVEKLLMCQLSLDCQPHPEMRGWQDFVGVLAVPLPAWPIPVTASAADDGEDEEGYEPGVAVSRIEEDDDFVFITASSSPPIQYVPAGVYLTEQAMYAIAGLDPAQIVRDNAVSFEAALRGDMS